MRFLIVNDITVDYPITIDVFKDLLGNNIKINKADDKLVIYHSFDNIAEINSIVTTLSAELMINIKSYSSIDSDIDKLNKELNIAMSLFDKLPVGNYDFKSAIISCNNITNKHEILEMILESTGIDEEFIKAFANNNLNVSKVSNELYLHRNTVNYKVDKLNSLTGFDLRVFKDAYILYFLIENK